MGGGLLQLAAYGAQDVYLTGNPQITFWKVVYRRYTNFAMESIEQNFDSDMAFGKTKLVCTLSRSGDLVHKIWLQVNLGDPNVNENGAPRGTKTETYDHAVQNSDGVNITLTPQSGTLTGTYLTRTGTGNSWLWSGEANNTIYQVAPAPEASKTRLTYSGTSDGVDYFSSTSTSVVYIDGQETYYWAKNIGFLLIQSIDIEIGGIKIDKHYGEWMHLMWKYTLPHGKTELAGPELLGEESYLDSGNNTLFIPLQFWFCRNPGLAIPIIALQYHEIKLNLEVRALNQLVVKSGDVDATSGEARTYETISNYTGKPTISGNFWVDYIYLDPDERRRFAQISHEYLIEQVQSIGTKAADIIPLSNQGTHTQKLVFNHPVKELIWTLSEKVDQTESFDEFFSYGYSDAGENGSPIYLKTARLTLNGNDRIKERHEKYYRIVQPFQHHTRYPTGVNNVFFYSFALKPEEHLPSGTCNFSRIDNAELKISYSTTTDLILKVHAWNYNVLKISSGMAGLAFTN